MNFAKFFLLATFLVAGNCQWMIHNTSQIINTTVIRTSGLGGPINPHPAKNTAPLYRPSVYSNYNVTRYNGSHHLIVGTPGFYDVLLFRQWYQKPGMWLQTREKIVRYPATSAGLPGRFITAIRIYDQYTNGHGGYATIISGGIGHRNATIRLYSQRGRGFNFIVEIFGH